MSRKFSKKDELYSPVPRATVEIFIVMILLCVLFAKLYINSGITWMFSCAITFGTIAYHFVIRFLAPPVICIFTRKKYDYKKWWFRQRSWEPKLFEKLRVRDWKDTSLTYDPREFSTKVHTLEEIVNNMCHAEVVHEFIFLMSFTSLLFAIPFGAFIVFLITAIAAALFDLTFVIIQRYNRPRVVKLMERKQRRK